MLVPSEPPYIVFGDHTKIKKYINFRFIAGADGVKVIKPFDVINCKLFYYFLCALKVPDRGYSRHYQFLKNSEFPLPPLAEQERIVAKTEELFSSLDKGIELLKTAQGQLKVYRQAVLKQAFEGRLTNKDVKDGELPEGWTEQRVGQMLRSIHGGTTAVPTDTLTDYTILRSSSVRAGSIDYSDIRYISANDFEGNTSIVREGDLLFTRLNGTIEYVGNCALVVKGFQKNLMYPDRLYCARVIDESYSKYIELIFQAPYVRKIIEKKAKSTAGHKRISIPDIRELTIPVPPSHEAQKIVSEIESRLSVCDKLEESIAQSLGQAEAVRQSILKKAFEGRLVPQDPDDEPASFLLKRIRAEREAVGSAPSKKAWTGQTKRGLLKRGRKPRA